MRAFFFLIAIFLTNVISANTYYFSSVSGQDSYSISQAQNKDTPWKSLKRLNNIFRDLNPGDSILFKRGEIFYGSIIISKSGTLIKPIFLGAFGIGTKPLISGFTTVNLWKNIGDNIWESVNEIATGLPPNMVTINGVSVAMGRYPNIGWNIIESSTKSSITSASLNAINWAGAEVVVRKERWAIDRSKITSHKGSTIAFASSGLDPLKGWGYFIQNDARTLNRQNEWYYSSATKKMRIFSTRAPLNVKIATVDTLVNCSNKDYIEIDNISFQGANRNIFLIRGCSYLRIQNCDLNFCGDIAIFGQNSESNSNYISVRNNTFNHNTGKALFLEGHFLNAYVGYNMIKNTGMLVGMGSGDGSACRTAGSKTLIEHNRIDSSMYVAINFSGDSTIVQNNFITNSCLKMDDGGAIYTWTGRENISAKGQKVLRNIVLNSIGNNEGTLNLYNSLYGNGIYMDDYTSDVEIAGNTVAACSNGGIFLHNTSNLNVHDNVCYNNTENLLMQDDDNAMRSNSIIRNIFFARTSMQHTASFKTMRSGISSFGRIDSNYYVSPIQDNLTIQTVEDNWKTNNYRSLSQWKSLYGKDPNSKTSPIRIKDINYLRFEYNATTSPRTIKLGERYIDATGKQYNGVLTLPPFSSVVLIKNDNLNVLPKANAGADQTVTLPTETVLLTGIGSSSASFISTFAWRKVAGPLSGTITNKDSIATSVTQLIPGVYLFELLVIDNSSLTGKDTVQVTVKVPITDAPILSANDVANTLSAYHALGNSEIMESENNGIYKTYTGQIKVGNVARPAGYWKFKTKAVQQRGESKTISSPAFTITTTPKAPTLLADDEANILSVTHTLGKSEILVSENGNTYVAYKGQINVGNIARAAGYWKFKIKAAVGRNESNTVNSPQFKINSLSQCSAAGTISYERWKDIPGLSITNIHWTKTPSYTKKLTFFEAPIDAADNYASRIRGYICPPQTGNYYLAIAGDDATELWVSTDEYASNKRKIACNPILTGSREWYKYSSQVSSAVFLQTGKKYYVEALHKEGTGKDHLAVAWKLPNGTIEAPIPGIRLSPYNLEQVWKIANTKANEKLNNKIIGTNLKVYPNPITTTATISIRPVESGISSLVVYDVQAKAVQTIFKGTLAKDVEKKIVFNSNGLSTGFYLLKLITKNEVIDEKIIITR